MKSCTLPSSPVVPAETHAYRIGFWGIVFVAALVLWYGLGTTVFGQNRYMLAFWFVVTKILGPAALFSLGWLCHAVLSRTSAHSIPKLVGIHISILVLLTAALPIPLSVVNLIPWGQTTGQWQGSVTSHESLSAGGVTGSAVVVSSEVLGPMLRFPISLLNYKAVDRRVGAQGVARVQGSVVRGFLGVPVAVALDPETPVIGEP